MNVRTVPAGSPLNYPDLRQAACVVNRLSPCRGGRGGRGDFGTRGIDGIPLLGKVGGDRSHQSRVGDEMCRMGNHRHIAARQLVLALRAGLDSGKPVRDRPFDGLMVAELEMQKGVILHAAPMASVECDVADEVECAGDRAPVAEGKNQQHALRQTFTKAREEIAREVGLAPFARAGIHVEHEERVPIRFRDVASGAVPYRETGRQRVPPLALQGLALAGGQGVEEIRVVAIAAVRPMVLQVRAAQVAGGFEHVLIRRRCESRVDGGGAGLPPQRREPAQQRLPLRAVRRRCARQQSPAAHGGERRRQLKLWIIAPARALISIRPGMVEHVFAIGMILEKGWRARHQPALHIVKQEMRAGPAGLWHCRAGLLQRQQKSMQHEGVMRLFLIKRFRVFAR